MRDNGKFHAEMSAQTRCLAEWYRYDGGLADEVEGAVVPTNRANIFNFTRYEPPDVDPRIDDPVRKGRLSEGVVNTVTGFGAAG